MSGQEKLWMKDIQAMKDKGQKFIVACPWDYHSAQMAEEAGAEILAIGGPTPEMFLGGKLNAFNASIDDVAKITANIARAVTRPVLLVSLTYGSFHVSDEQAVGNAIKLVQAGAHCVKAQVPGKLIRRAEALINAGIAFEGHVGLLPHLMYKRGGFKVYGKTSEEGLEIYKECKRLEDIGACCIEMECVPHQVAAEITKRLRIPVLGIGSGPETDGQFLVMQDILGLQKTLELKFVKRYADLWPVCCNALKQAGDEVRSKVFPAKEHTFSIKEQEFEKFMEKIDSV